MDEPANLSLPASDKALQELAALELARSGSPRRAAKKAGVPVETIKLWQKDVEFNALVLETGTVPLCRTVSMLVRTGPLAVKALREEMLPKKRMRGPSAKDAAHMRKKPKPDDTEADPRKIRAARIILDYISKFGETRLLVDRIRALEDRHSLPALPDPNVIDAEVIS